MPAAARQVPPTPEQVRAAPKVLLHDHLDGGLRPATVVELAAEHGYAGLPTTDPQALGRWFRESAGSGSLEGYLATFRHTVGVTQTAAALVRVARECAEDLAADGVVHAEVRYAPELHVAGGLALAEVVEAVQEGFRQGCAGSRLRVAGLLTAMREGDRAIEVAELAVRSVPDGVVGLDLAGAEAGHPAGRHLAAFRHVQAAGLPVTVHAGEGYGLASIREALHVCGADRLGHGVRIVDDVRDGVPGPLAEEVRDRAVPLEVCPTSNVQTGAARSVAEHPVGLLHRLGLRVTVNTDNRLMSGVSLTSELVGLAAAFGWDGADLHRLTVAALDSAFLPEAERQRLRAEVVDPGWAPLQPVEDRARP